MREQCRAGPGWPEVCKEANAPLTLSFSLLLSGQVNNATARVMTNKKTANPYTNGKGPRTAARLQGPSARTRALEEPRPLEAHLPGCQVPPRVPALPGQQGVDWPKREEGWGRPRHPHSWQDAWAFPSTQGTQKPRGQAWGTVGVATSWIIT